jgi:capsular polysaccharide export protein
VLGVAVFDIPGLSFQGPLDEFWNAPTAPDAALRDAFARVLIAATQVKGNFYHPEGRAVAVREAANRLIDQRVNEPGAFVDPPPRLERARTLGIPVSFGSE